LPRGVYFDAACSASGSISVSLTVVFTLFFYLTSNSLSATMEDQTYNSMDVDDLFGDSEEVTLPSMNMSAAPPVKGLAKRLDELAASGCCS
jgi:hypothetical protein